MVIDALAQQLFDKKFDRNGAIAARGLVLADVLEAELRLAYYRLKPPRSAGREQFGREFVREFLRRCGQASKHDIVATATALTARSIGMAVRNFVLPLDEDADETNIRRPTFFREFVVSGGGTKNATLIRMIGEELADLKMRVRTTDEFGLPSEAKEAVAFALLAYHTWRRVPSNIPSATGAKRPAILGKVNYA